MERSSSQPFVCLTCEEQFSNQLLLRKHIPIHSNLSAYPCTQCPDPCKQKKQLNRHLKNNHQDYYNSSHKTPFGNNKPQITDEAENSNESISYKDSDLKFTSKDSSKNLESALKEETSQMASEAKIEIAVPQVIYLNKTRADQQGFAWKTPGEKKAEKPKNFNWILYERFIKFSNRKTAGKPTKNTEGKGFVPLKEEKCGRDPKVLQINASKRIEFLEENIRKFKLKEETLSWEIESARTRNKELEDEIGRLKEKYKISKR